ncbi:MAG: cell envelope integrity protein CreD [Pseudomonadota bacterium]
MAQNPFANLIPRGSMGLKLLLVCLLVLVMGVPLLMVGGIVGDRQVRATQVTTELGDKAGGQQVVGGPMLLVPYTRTIDANDDQGRPQRRVTHGFYLLFARDGTANTTLVTRGVERRLGIYRAAGYRASTAFNANFDPAEAIARIEPGAQLDWRNARIIMFVHDSRAIQDAAEVRFGDGSTAMLEPMSDLSSVTTSSAPSSREYIGATVATGGGLQAFAAPAPLANGPHPFTAETRLTLGGAQRFSIAAFAQNTTVTIRGDRRDTKAEGYFQTASPVALTEQGFVATWRVPFVARGIEKAADLGAFNLGEAANRDMAVSFVSADDIYQGVVRAVRYGIMFIGIVFLATLIFEAVSGKKAHPAQYVLVGLAQCVFYLLLLSMTELIGFTPSFLIAAIATVGLLGFYAGETFKSRDVGVRALIGLALLYAAMYVLMTLEDFALLAGSVVAFVVIAATMIATRRIDWYGRSAPATETAAER